MPHLHADFILENYDYSLPKDRIAQNPPATRGDSRLFVLDRKSPAKAITSFSSFPALLPDSCLLVANNSRVIPARMFGRKSTGGKVEFLLLTPLALLDIAPGKTCNTAEAWGLIRASRRCKTGDIIVFTDNFKLEVLNCEDFGRCKVLLYFSSDIQQTIRECGHMPLPPYIERPDNTMDEDRYQTVYSREDRAGSVAAPTAGLHFTQTMKKKLLDAGCQWAELTLYVGYGTFSPVRCQDIRQHDMHAEYIEIPKETAEAVAQAKLQGKPVLAVGTTSLRALEGAFAAQGTIAPYSGWTDIFLYPGKPTYVVDHLLTNFHLPQSTLLMLVAALAGRQRILAAYQKALDAGFRFFSYGDAMLIL